MKEKIRKLPFRKKLLYSYLILLFLFAAGIIFYTVQQTHRLMQMDMDYMDQANQQMNLTLEMVEEDRGKFYAGRAVGSRSLYQKFPCGGD